LYKRYTAAADVHLILKKKILKMFDSCRLYQTWPVFLILVSGWFNYQSLLLWNRLAKWTKTW